MNDDYVQEKAIIILMDDREIQCFIEDYDIKLDAFLVINAESNEYLLISRKIIKSIEVVK
ncbi:MAG: hypothetical protein ACP5JE_06040 [Thermoplasmata archaeon]